jgi:hypothetical protein
MRSPRQAPAMRLKDDQQALAGRGAGLRKSRKRN